MWLKDLHNEILLSWSELKTSFGGGREEEVSNRKGTFLYLKVYMYKMFYLSSSVGLPRQL